MTKCSRFLWFLTTELRESSGRYLVRTTCRWPNTNASNSVGLRKKRNNDHYWFKTRQHATRMPLYFHKVFCLSLLISTRKVSNLNQYELSFLRVILGFNSTGRRQSQGSIPWAYSKHFFNPWKHIHYRCPCLEVRKRVTLESSDWESENIWLLEEVIAPIYLTHGLIKCLPRSSLLNMFTVSKYSKSILQRTCTESLVTSSLRSKTSSMSRSFSSPALLV